jgi:hypothetical protein
MFANGDHKWSTIPVDLDLAALDLSKLGCNTSIDDRHGKQQE